MKILLVLSKKSLINFPIRVYVQHGQGQRSSSRSASVNVGVYTLPDILAMELDTLPAVLGAYDSDEITDHIMSELNQLVLNLIALGLGHLSLDRSARDISQGELQRIKIARKLHSSLAGILYIFDEPSAGLSRTDTQAMLPLINKLKTDGNSVILVEHNPLMLAAADLIIEIGPGAGTQGGEIIFMGTPVEYQELNASFASINPDKKVSPRMISHYKETIVHKKNVVNAHIV